MTINVTERGFECIEFEDANNNDCSLQQSSATERLYSTPGASFVWLGIDKVRMHLNRQMVEELVKHMSAWLKYGSFEPR